MATRTTKKTPARKRAARSTAAPGAAIYVRISDDRVGAGLGVQRQEEDCRKLARKLGWPVVAVFKDNDISAYSGKRRPQYAALLDALASGEVQAVIAWHNDRLHRSPKELEHFIEIVEEHDVQVAMVTAGQFDLTSASGRLNARNIGAFARFESEHKSERVRSQRDQIAAQGLPTGGRRAFGYESDGMTIRADEAKLIRSAAKRFLAGESLRQIAIDWNERGIRAYNGNGWYVTSMKTILTNPRYAALRVHRGEIIGDAAWKPILTRDTYERIRGVLGDPRRTRKGRPASYLLSGLLRCGRCGKTMHTSKSQHRERRYMCTKSPGGKGTHACGRCAIQAEKTEETVENELLDAFDSKAFVRSLRATRGKGDESSDGDADRLGRLEVKATEIEKMYEDDEIDRAEYLRMRADVRGKIEELHRSFTASASTDVLRPYLRAGALRAACGGLDIDRKRAIIAAVIEHIEIGPATILGKFDPDRVEPLWRY